MKLLIIMLLMNCSYLLSHNIYNQQLRGVSYSLRQGHISNSKDVQRIHTKVQHRHHIVAGKLHGKLTHTHVTHLNKKKQSAPQNVVRTV